MAPAHLLRISTLAMSCVPLGLLLAIARPAQAQEPREILEAAARAHRELHSYEAEGVLQARTALGGSSYQVFWPVSLAEADSTRLPAGTPVPQLSPLIRFGIRQYRDASGEVTERPAIEPSSPNGWSLFGKIDQGVEEVRSLGTETLQSGDGEKQCRVLEVSYGANLPSRALSGHPIRYWIDPATSRVSRTRFGYRDRALDKLVEWDFTATSIKTNQSPPQWALAALPQLGGSERREWAGRRAPAFRLPDLDGREVTLAGLKGKVVVLSFWASWCVPCQEEMPLLERLRADWEGRGIEVWGVSNESVEKARQWLQQHGRSLPTLIDEGREAFESYEVDRIPVTVIIDPEGNIAGYHEGLTGETRLRNVVEPVAQGSGLGGRN